MDIQTINKYRRGLGKSPIISNGNKYQYILDHETLIDAYLRSRADLDYRLKKEVKRDRFVENKAALQEELTAAIEQALRAGSKEISEVVAQDIHNAIEAAFAGSTSGSAAKGSKFDLGSMIGRALGSLPTTLLDQIYDDTMKD